MRKLTILLIAYAAAAASAQDVKVFVDSYESQGLQVLNQGSSFNKTAIVGDNGTYDYYGTGVHGLGNYYGVKGNGANYGVYGEGSTGVHGYGSTGYGGGWGVYGAAYVYDDYTNAYGVHGEAPVYADSWAGYFNGKVNVTGDLFWSSDAKLKKNVRPFENGLATIMKLQPKIYEYNREIKEVNLAKGTHLGLIAQELETVLPELVSTTKVVSSKRKPGPDGKPEKKEAYSYKAVNYTELIPVLIKGMQEQQAIIEQLKAKVLQLEAR